MRTFSLTTVVFSMISAIVASPVLGEGNTTSNLSKRGNGNEILYLVTCNGQPHGSIAAYYAHWQDSQTYGAHYPDAVSTSNGGIPPPGSNLRAQYVFPDSRVYATINVVDPGWYQVAGDADNSFGTHFTCRMDNGRQLFSDCFSNYYCQNQQTMNIFNNDEEDTLRERAKGIRKIREVSITSSEIERLIVGGHKLDSSTVNALCAKAQFDAEALGSTDCCVFSLWLGPLVAGKVKVGRVHASVLEQALEAVPDHQIYSLKARTKWIIPLCSFTKPANWILAWIDFGSSQIQFFDSIPEMASTSWAEPLLLKIIDKIFLAIGEPLTVWHDGRWKRVLNSLAVLERQLNGWSCGLFVTMAVMALLKGLGVKETAGNRGLKAARKGAVEALLDLPIFRAPRGADSVPYATDKVEVVAELGPCPPLSIRTNENSMVVDTASIAIANSEGQTSSSDKTFVESKGGQEPAGDDSYGVSKEDDGTSTLPQKRLCEIASDFDNENNPSHQGGKAPKLSFAAKPARKKPMTSSQRETALKNDKWVRSFNERLVTCEGCRSQIKLSAQEKRIYELKNWKEHKATCPHITGHYLVRSRKVLTSKPSVLQLPGQLGIGGFFSTRSGGETQDSPAQLSTTFSATNVGTPAASVPVKYDIRTVKSHRQTPSITNFFSSGPQTRSGTNTKEVKVPNPGTTVQCKHLQGPNYEEYISLTNTRGFGGVDFSHIARAAQQLFPYKTFPPLKDGSDIIILDLDVSVGNGDVPLNGNLEVEKRKWTSAEMHQLEAALKPWVRWEVNYIHRYVKSSLCDGLTGNTKGICDQCLDLVTDESFKQSLRRKNNEANLSQEKPLEKLESRIRYAKSDGVKLLDQNSFWEKLQDPVLFRLHNALKTGGPEDCFLSLFESAQCGELKSHQQFLGICDVFADRLKRENSGNSNAKFGIRYKTDYIQFMTVLRGYGQNSNRQFKIISAALFAPSSRQIKSGNSLRNPALIFENVARVKRYVDLVNYTGPVFKASDATKVRKRLNYSAKLGAHVLGTIFDLSEVEVENAKSIDNIVKRTAKEKAFATQTRAIIAKVPLPGSPPIVIALLPTNGTETAEMIHLQHLQLQKMAAQLKLPLIALAADGAASELAAQFMMDKVQTEEKSLVYDYPLYGIHLRAPVFADTGPLISVTDAPHARKTARNQPQYGTHTASLGVGHLVNQSLVGLYETGAAGLVVRDVANVDKQDDGAARRVFHHQALEAYTTKDNPNMETVSIRPGFEGVFTYLFVLGQLFEAWMSPSMTTHERVLAALRARFWLHYWRQHVLGLSLAFAKFYPDQPFCIWLIATDFVEHFFGISRKLLPNFSYVEFIKIAQHVMIAHDEAVRICRDILSIPVSQPRGEKPLVLVSLGAATAKRAHGKKAKNGGDDAGDNADGYASDIGDEESDGDNEEDDDDQNTSIGVTNKAVPIVPLGDAAAVAAHETAAFSAICQDLEVIVESAGMNGEDIALPLPVSFNKPPITVADVFVPVQNKGTLVDSSSKIAIHLLLKNRKSLQSGTVTKSERVVAISKKYTGELHEKITADGGKEIKFKADEAAHRLWIAQETNTELKREEVKKTRQVRWQSIAKQIEKDLLSKKQVALPQLSEKNVTALNELKRGSFLIMRTTKRFYIGEVLDIYKKGQSLSWLSLRVYLELGLGEINTSSEESDSHSTSEDSLDESSDDMPDFLCIGSAKMKYHLHTHAPVDNVLYHPGPKALVGSRNKMSLVPASALYWTALNKAKSTVLKGFPALQIRIPISTAKK
ncbi:hypothetical protein CPB83DRAFT_837122 [Crepidotus variabilis]|uniref:Ubiquitin-like protease family profile domain-containing protein n=1 Tax=Crepidotus variabilis TaxID=179855 RepID=A0A9P6ECB6_9AGAR|nr:hypothetical protein CPB83DRAFT_837122 [Crepidotus variabilis]